MTNKTNTRNAEVVKTFSNAWSLKRSIYNPQFGWIELPNVIYYSKKAAVAEAKYFISKD